MTSPKSVDSVTTIYKPAISQTSQGLPERDVIFHSHDCPLLQWGQTAIPRAFMGKQPGRRHLQVWKVTESRPNDQLYYGDYYAG